MPKLTFYKQKNTAVLNYKSYVHSWIQEHPKSELHIGCDSKVKPNGVKYSVSICMRNIGNGVHEIYATEFINDKTDNYTRLWREVNMAVELARELDDLAAKIHIHVDLNQDPKYFSNRLYEASVGFISSLGYEAIAKPDAWAASSGAHAHCQ